MNKVFGHFKTITKHRILVRHYCFKCGQYKRGLLHDLSKYSLIEFKSGCKYYTGTSSPINNEKTDIGFSYAWQHHKGRNPHHWEYWIDEVGTYKNEPIKMPWPYLIEMICDWIGAGKVYMKKEWTQSAPYDYYENYKDKMIINKKTKKVIEFLLKIIKEEGLKKFYKVCREPETYTLLYNYIEGNK